MSDLHDRANALAGELIQLKREVAKSGDLLLNQRLKEVTRILRSPRGEFSESGYDRLQERIAEELYGEADSQEQAVKARKDSLKAHTRAQVEADLQAERNELADRETAVAAREERSKPSYRARFVAAGAGVVLALDALIRLVA